MLEFEVTLAEHEDIEKMQVRAKNEFFRKYQDDMQKIMLLEHFGLEIPRFIDRGVIISEFEKTNIKAGDKINVRILPDIPFHGFCSGPIELYKLSEYRIYLDIPYYEVMYLGIDIQDKTLEKLKVFTEDSIELIKEKHKEMIEQCKKDLQEKNKIVKQENIKEEIKKEVEKIKEPYRTTILDKLKELI